MKQAKRQVSWRGLAAATITLAALGLIFAGVWQLHRPAALIVVGALVWIDLQAGHYLGQRKDP